jgi:peptidoglycan/xylan/chitin deacetylase (PgdA/CDA1 family)
MKKLLALLLAVILILAGCISQTPVDNFDNTAPVEQPGEEDGQDQDEEQGVILEPIDLKEVKPNEVGEIMVLMYHHVAGDKEETWVRTPDNFRKDLKVLYDKGYRLISMRDFVNNNINVEAGYTPVVLTFDDGNQNNFNLIEKDGEFMVDPDSAVGIMEAFYSKHPDFGLNATFYIFYGLPFGQKDLVGYKLQYLVDRGFEIGNHTIGHNDLSKASPQQIQEYLARHAAKTQEYIPAYEVDSLALPYGGMPKGDDYNFTVSGHHDGVSYHNKAVLWVGWSPSLSPIHKNFDPARIHRIRASEVNVDNVGMYDWLKVFDQNPSRRYISDGNPNTITVPEERADRVDLERLGDKKLIIYNSEGEVIN